MQKGTGKSQNNRRGRILSVLAIALAVVLLISIVFLKNGIKLRAGGFYSFVEASLENPDAILSGKLDG